MLLVGLGGVASGQKPDPAKTDWLVAGKYGVFVHYLTGLQNNPDHVASLGRQTSWDECVRAIKPDGPGQPGTQMSIAELEAYE